MTDKKKVLRNPSPEEIEKLEQKQMGEAPQAETTQPLKVVKNNDVVDNVDTEFKSEDIFSPKKVEHKLILGKHNYPDIPYISDKSTIWIRRMTATEEGYFYEGLEQGFSMELFFQTINRMIDSCVRTNIDTYELSLLEKTPLFLHILALTYGEDHNFKIKCHHCETEHDIKINILKDLKPKYMQKSFKLPVEIKLETYDFPLLLKLDYPKLKEEQIYLNTETNWLGKVRTIISSITGKLPDGVDVCEDHYDSIINNIDQADTKKIKDTLNNIVTNYGIDLGNVELKNFCKNKNCEVWNKDQVHAIPLDEILLNVFKQE